MNLTQALHRAAQQEPDRPLTICDGRVRTVAESAGRVARLACALRALGMTAGDRVGLMSLNSDAYHEALLAVPWAGGVVNPVNIRWSPAEIAYSLVDCDTRLLLVDDAFAALIPELRERVARLETVVYCGHGATPDAMHNLEELVADQAELDDERRGGGDLYGVFYTGGTTGAPKGVMLSHDNLSASALASMATLEVLTRGGRLLHVAPMFHLAAVGAWLIGMLIGSTHVIEAGFTPAGTAAALAEHDVTDALLVPTMIQMLLDSPDTADADLTGIRRILYGAAPMPAALLARARERMSGARFAQAFGMTELAPAATLLSDADHDHPVRSRSAGRAIATVDVHVVDPDGAPLPRGEIGEIAVRGDNVMLGYWNKPEETSTALRDGWMHTGDAAYMDDEGYVFIVDRIKDMIVTGGENVYSVEVENVLATHPSVAACAVIGIPDDVWGERVHAVVVAASGASTDADVLRAFCRARIAGYKVPRSVAFVDALPLSAAGKVLKRELRRRYRDVGTKRAVDAVPPERPRIETR